MTVSRKQLNITSSNVAFGSQMSYLLPKSDINVDKMYVEFTLSAIGGTLTPSITAFDMSAISRVVLLYNEQQVEQTLSEEIYMNSRLFRDQSELLGHLEMTDDVSLIDRRLKTLAGDKMYLDLSWFVSRHIKHALASYPSKWKLEITINSLDRIVDGADATVATGTINSAKMYLEGNQYSLDQIKAQRAVLRKGFTYDFLDAVQVTRNLPSAQAFSESLTEVTGDVSTVLMMARDSSVLTTNPLTLDPIAFYLFGQSFDDTYELGSSSVSTLYSGAAKSFALSVNTSAKHFMGGPSFIDRAGALRNMGVSVLASTSPMFQADYLSGTRRGSMKFSSEELLTIQTEAITGTTIRLDIFIYRWRKATISGASISFS